jgi:chromate transporter
VLPYVYQGAVEQHQWLTPVQMIDGLALGETTPGPLIMVVSFVGFVGGWTKAIFGADSLFLSGAVAAAVVTFFTFLPSFFFILLGAPLVESTHGNLHFTAPLTGITAAVVGVIVNLAVFFAYHVLWPRGTAGDFEWLAAGIGVAAAIALFRFKIGRDPGRPRLRQRRTGVELPPAAASLNEASRSRNVQRPVDDTSWPRSRSPSSKAAAARWLPATERWCQSR